MLVRSIQKITVKFNCAYINKLLLQWKHFLSLFLDSCLTMRQIHNGTGCIQIKSVLFPFVSMDLFWRILSELFTKAVLLVLCYFTEPQQRVWPIRMRWRSSVAVRNGSRRSDTCKRFWRPRSSFCRRCILHSQTQKTDTKKSTFTVLSI